MRTKNCVFFVMNQVEYLHFIGIGGSGMSGIAEIFIHEGYHVTGSDIICNDRICRLLKLGAKIFFGHRSENIGKADVVIVSSAINPDNPEIIAARFSHIPIVKRGIMLSEIMRFRYGIAISGTHGKTTTTTMIVNIYIMAGLDPTFINGGYIKSEDVYAHLGYDHDLIVEADESDGSFLYLRPIVEVITNIGLDHIDAYQRDFKNLKQAFVNFLYQLPFYGYAVVCIDDPVVREIISNVNRRIITYGFSEDADFFISNYEQCLEKSSFTITNKKIYRNKLKIVLNSAPGIHNALNATAAVIVAIEEGIHEDNIIQSMLDFKGTKRRFENLGFYSLSKINGKIGKIILIDDYGHHPTELYVTIQAIRTGYPTHRLVMVFQPHRFTRTRDLYNDFVNVLSNVDVLLIMNIYSSGEESIIGIDSQNLCSSIQKYGKICPFFIANEIVLSEVLAHILQDNDLLLVQGAGTIGEVVRKLIIKNNALFIV